MSEQAISPIPEQEDAAVVSFARLLQSKAGEQLSLKEYIDLIKVYDGCRAYQVQYLTDRLMERVRLQCSMHIIAKEE